MWTGENDLNTLRVDAYCLKTTTTTKTKKHKGFKNITILVDGSPAVETLQTHLRQVAKARRALR